MNQCGVLIVGGGVVGLSVAATIARNLMVSGGVMLLERHRRIGQETSSRNSEVIHASVYYPENSFKSRLCALGNTMMYSICAQNGIPHIRTGKLLIAKTESELALLPQVLKAAKASGGEGLRIVDSKEIRELEPNVCAPGAVYCPTSGIVDSHSLMAYFEQDFLNSGGDIVFNSEVTGVEKINGGKDGYRVEVTEANLSGKDPVYGSTTTIETKYLINCAGIMSQKISKLVGINLPQNDIHPTRGMYFRVNHKLDKYPKMLVYPLPDTSIVGIHTCPDVWGGMRLGPFEQWIPKEVVDRINDSQDRSYIGSKLFDLVTPEELGPFFVESCRPFLPFLELEDISPDIVGIHPKIQQKGEPMKDWIIAHEAERGAPGFINLVGIESPGLTASPALGKHIAELLQTLSGSQKRWAGGIVY